MAERHPFVLLDDARESGAADALLFENPRQVFVAHRPEQVEQVLADAEDARRAGGELAGYVAYEAGLALEEKLRPRAEARSGGTGPLVWLGMFDAPARIPAADVPQWLATHAQGSGSVGPLDPRFRPAATPRHSGHCRKQSAQATSTRRT